MASIIDDFKYTWNRQDNPAIRIIIINAAVFVLQLFLGDALGFLYLTHQPGGFIYQPWSLLTYGFTHVGFSHILFNMLGLYWFSIVINEHLGFRHLIPLLIWGIIAGGVSFLIAGNIGLLRPDAILLGASGGVFAVMIAAATKAPEYRFHLLFIGPVQIRYIALVYIVFALAGIIGANKGNAGGEMAHLAGALLGYFYVKGLQSGTDLSKPINNTINWFQQLFSGGFSLKGNHKVKQSVGRPGRSSSSGSYSSSPSSAQIDAILDKISESGYENLTSEEKQILFKASQK